jgi:hypothetical protein
MVTRIWDKAVAQERSNIYVPAFPIAEWIVANWWALLNEPLRTAEIPHPAPEHRAWTKRHCLRSADSGTLLPACYIFSDGRQVRIQWYADETASMPNMPGEFVDSGSEAMDTPAVEDALAEFVSEVMKRVDHLSDERVDALKDNWRAVRNADPEERRFCVTAGRLGLDPYDPCQLSDDVATFIESIQPDPDIPLVRDLTESVEPELASEQWQCIRDRVQDESLGPIAIPPGLAMPEADHSPSRFGYRAAARVRELASMDVVSPIKTIANFASRICSDRFEVIDCPIGPSVNVNAVVGGGNRRICMLGPRPNREDSQRFLDARGLFHALLACEHGGRLVTRGYTWDQQASRAFAAELLAPRAALAERVTAFADRTKIEELAVEFNASTVLIAKQLENACIDVLYE